MIQNRLKKYLINIVVLMDDVDCFADVDFVSPPYKKKSLVIFFYTFTPQLSQIIIRMTADKNQVVLLI